MVTEFAYAPNAMPANTPMATIKTTADKRNLVRQRLLASLFVSSMDIQSPPFKPFHQRQFFRCQGEPLGLHIWSGIRRG